MEGFTVKHVQEVEEKGVQQVEQELLDKHNKDLENQNNEVQDELKKESEPQEDLKIGEENIISYIKERYDKDITSVDELFSQKEQNEELPEDVATFLKYKKETGRGLNDFMSLNKNYDEVPEDQLLAEYYLDKNPHLDKDDVDFKLKDSFGTDEYSEESDVKSKQIAKKEELAKARKYFNDQKSQYQTPVESTEPWVSEEDKKNYEAYKNKSQEDESYLEDSKKKSAFFSEKTNELFNDSFEGFKFNVNDNEYVYKPAEASKLKETQSDINNFIGMHLNEDGYVADAESYHKSLAVAMNPESFAKYFYEQGKADAVTDDAKKSKNIDMGNVRSAPETVSTGGMKITSVDSSHGNGLKIRSKK
jgi:hypothetical protein